MGLKVRENLEQPGVMTPATLVQGVAGLVSLPEVCIRVGEMVDDPCVSAAHIGKIISQDSALTARLLRIVNSAFYRFPNKIDTVTRAVTIVGRRDLRDLVIAATVSGIFERISTELIDLNQFWRHAIYTGILARIIAVKCRVLHRERLFIAGLMHDIGRLIICFKIPEKARSAILRSEEKDIPVYLAEQEVIGFDHAQVGAQLMRVWDFPQSLEFATRYHHNPNLGHASALEIAIVHLADIVSRIAESGDCASNLLETVDRDIWLITNVKPTDIELLLIESREQFIETLLLFRPKDSSGTTGYAA